MARPCTICTHPRRGEIDLAVLNGGVWAVVGREFGVSGRAVGRHATQHLRLTVQQLYADSQGEEPTTYIEELKQTRRRLFALLAEGERTGNVRIRMYAIDRLQKQAALEANLIGDLPAEIDIANHPRWIVVRNALFRVLDQFPEARRAVAEGLKGVDC